MVSGRSWVRYVPSGLVALGLAVLLVGMARPEVKRTLLHERATVILVVDTSRSMQARDVAPTRLGAAQEALRTFLSEAPHDLRVGLVVFAGEAQVATPPTKDHELVNTAIADIDQFLVYGGTAIGDALQTAVLLGRQVTDLAPTDQGSVTLLTSDHLTRTPRAGGAELQTRRALSRSSSSRTASDARAPAAPLEGAQLAREACFPVYGRALERRRAWIERGPFGGVPGSPSGRSDDPRASRPRKRSGHREDDGWRVLGGPVVGARSSVPTGTSRSWLGRRVGESEITWLFLAIAGVLLLVATAVGTSSRRASLKLNTTTIVKGRSARSSRPAGCMTTEKTPFGPA